MLSHTQVRTSDIFLNFPRYFELSFRCKTELFDPLPVTYLRQHLSFESLEPGPWFRILTSHYSPSSVNQKIVAYPQLVLSHFFRNHWVLILFNRFSAVITCRGQVLTISNVIHQKKTIYACSVNWKVYTRLVRVQFKFYQPNCLLFTLFRHR